MNVIRGDNPRYAGIGIKMRSRIYIRLHIANSLLWKRVIAWERSRVASGYGIIWGTQVETNMAEFSAESRGVDCSGDRKVLTELQIAIRSKLLF